MVYSFRNSVLRTPLNVTPYPLQKGRVIRRASVTSEVPSLLLRGTLGCLGCLTGS